MKNLGKFTEQVENKKDEKKINFFNLEPKNL